MGKVWCRHEPIFHVCKGYVNEISGHIKKNLDPVKANTKHTPTHKGKETDI